MYIVRRNYLSVVAHTGRARHQEEWSDLKIDGAVADGDGNRSESFESESERDGLVDVRIAFGATVVT